jgi:predicted nuclease with TOPRIM domain
MREQLEKRLAELQAEFEAGQKALAELETQQANLRNTLLRISGAIQVLEEELEKNSKTSSSTNGNAEAEILAQESMRHD